MILESCYMQDIADYFRRHLVLEDGVVMSRLIDNGDDNVLRRSLYYWKICRNRFFWKSCFVVAFCLSPYSMGLII